MRAQLAMATAAVFVACLVSGGLAGTPDKVNLNVASPAALMTALAAARGGDIILLQPGDYGALSLYSARETFARFAGEVTIRSADAGRKASFSGLMLRGVGNLTIDSVTFDYDAAVGASDRDKPFLIRESTGVTIRNSVFDGDLAEGVSEILDGYGTGHGLTVTTGCRNVTVENNEFVNWMRGAVFSDSDGLSVRGNDVHGVRSDGFNFVAVTDVLIEANHFHDFRGTGSTTDHLDMIQFWTAGTTRPSTGIAIRGNVFNSAAGTWTQSIFMRNEEVDTGRAGPEMFYRDIAIEDNLIHNAHAHAITVGETAGLKIRNNTLLHNRDSAAGKSVYIPGINLKDASRGVEVTGNIVPMKHGSPPAVTFGREVANNLIVQYDSPDGVNYVGDLFVNALAGKAATLADLRAKPGGAIERMGVGAAMTRASATAPAPKRRAVKGLAGAAAED